MRIIGMLITLTALSSGGWWTWQNVPQVRDFVNSHIDMGSFHTLEVRYTADQIMQAHASELLKDEDHKYLRPSQLFSPYLLMEVKYTDNGGSTREGMMLWSLEEGEMVMDANNWAMTHGFQDCITAKASSNDFRLLRALANSGGSMRRDAMANALHVELDLLDHWLDSCRQKKLIVQSGGDYRLHFQKPRLNVRPETRLNQSLVTKSARAAERVAKRYSISQVERLAQAAFGNDFTIRNSKEVFLPIYRITVQNPDGSRLTSYWNALNGQELQQSYF